MQHIWRRLGILPLGMTLKNAPFSREAGCSFPEDCIVIGWSGATIRGMTNSPDSGVKMSFSFPSCTPMAPFSTRKASALSIWKWRPVSNGKFHEVGSQRIKVRRVQGVPPNVNTTPCDLHSRVSSWPVEERCEDMLCRNNLWPIWPYLATTFSKALY
jgi:hypothetical protein